MRGSRAFLIIGQICQEPLTPPATGRLGPASAFVRPFYRLYTRGIIPAVGRLVSKDVRAYSYLPESIAAVPQRERMCALMAEAGFTGARFIPMTFGTCCIYTATKPVT